MNRRNANFTLIVCSTLFGCSHYSAAASADDMCGTYVQKALTGSGSWSRIGGGIHDAIVNADGPFTAIVTMRDRKGADAKTDRFFRCVTDGRGGQWKLLSMTEIQQRP